MNKKIIVIGRQYGSGGHELGEWLAKELGIPLYDRELAEAVSEKLNMSEEDVEAMDEHALSELVLAYQAHRKYRQPRGSYGKDTIVTDQVFNQQSAAIRGLAQQGACVIVGRCADYILRERKDVLSVFVRAGKEDRRKRLMNLYDLTESQAEGAIKKNDKSRRRYYEQHTGKKWGAARNYHLVLNMSALTMEDAVELLKAGYHQ